MLIQFSNSAHWIIYSVALVNNSLDFQGVNFITEIYLLFKVLNDFLWFFYNAFMAFWQRQSFSLHLKSTTCTLLKFPFVFHGSKKGFIRVWINTWVSIWWQNHIITFHLKYLSFNSMALRFSSMKASLLSDYIDEGILKVMMSESLALMHFQKNTALWIEWCPCGLRCLCCHAQLGQHWHLNTGYYVRLGARYSRHKH